MKCFTISLLVLLIGFCSAKSLFAKEPTIKVVLSDTTRIDEVAVLGQRLQIAYVKQNRNIQVLTQEEIRRLPARSIPELLTFVPGVDIRQRGPLGTQADLSIDGGSFDQTMVLINGVKMGDSQTGHHLLNLPLPLDAIERIEIIKGPASRIYGVNSLTGAVNIVTKENQENSVFAHATLGSSFKGREQIDKSGIYTSQSLQAGISMHNNKLKHSFYLGQESTNGHRYNTAADNIKLFYSGQYAINAKNSLSIMAGHIDNFFGANGYYAAPGDKDSKEEVKTSLVAFSSRHSLTERWQLMSGVSFRKNKDDYRYLGNKEVGRSEHSTETIGIEVNTRYKAAYGELGLGLESRFEKIQSSNIGDHSRDNHGAYMEYRIDPIQALSINMGAYVNYNSDYEWQIFPGIDMGFALTDKLRWILSAGSSQRLPSFTDLYLSQTGNVGNPNLKSENAFQIETGFKYISKKVDFQIHYFNRRINRFIEWTRTSDNEPYVPNNLSKTKTNGLGLSFKYQISEDESNTQFYIHGGYNYLDMGLEINPLVMSKSIIQSLRHQTILGFTINKGPFSLTSGNRFQERATYKSYILHDVRVNYKIKKWDLYVDAQNITNTKYTESGAVPMPGTWFALGLKKEWNF